jgi:hypothetical protein
MTERVAAEIKRANEVSDKIEELVVAKWQASTGDRNTLPMAYWSLVFEFPRAILCSASSMGAHSRSLGRSLRPQCAPMSRSWVLKTTSKSCTAMSTGPILLNRGEAVR